MANKLAHSNLILNSIRKKRHPWIPIFWFVLFGLTIWSYGFNNIPFIRPLPLVDALVFLIVLWSFTTWWKFRYVKIVRNIIFWIAFLSFVIVIRLIIDFPNFGILAARDALFAFELWVIFPAIAVGYLFGEEKLNKRLFWLFGLATLWFLTYPFRQHLLTISPIFGIQRPVPLFTWTTMGFISVPAFFWFIWHRRSFWGIMGGFACFLALLFAQARGPYLAFLLTFLVIVLTRPSTLPRWGRMGVTVIIALLAISLIDPLPGRLGNPVGIHTVFKQLETLFGKEGPGAGSFQHRIQSWPQVIDMVLSKPFGWLVGLGLGQDLFLGFTLGPDILVRKPHNDFLEIWARTGIFGLIAWIGLLSTLVLFSLQAIKQRYRNFWIFALQITISITSFAQPALGFAYTTIVWVGLTGIWLGATIRK